MSAWEIVPNGRRQYMANKYQETTNRLGVKKKSYLARFAVLIDRNQSGANTVNRAVIWSVIQYDGVYEDSIQEAKEQIATFFKITVSAVLLRGVDIQDDELQPGYSQYYGGDDSLGSTWYEPRPRQ